MLSALDPRVLVLACIGLLTVLAAILWLLGWIVWVLARGVLRLAARRRQGSGRHRAVKSEEEGQDEDEPARDFLTGLHIPQPCREHGPSALHLIHADGTRTCNLCLALSGEAP
ncbi:MULTISPECIES: hypothetical protein [Streptomyces]|uniref:hypothetical protein n=1 Tax=Streptomyces TaxID=1883 RepID=UPI00345C5CD9